MKKTINIRMTNARAAELGLPTNPGFQTALRPMELDTDTMTPAAAWIVDHITSTYVVDEVRDKIGIRAVSALTMMQRDIAAGRSPETVRAFAEGYGDVYTTQKMKTEITFPIYGKSFRRPEEVIESVVRDWIAAGAASLEAANGDTFSLVDAPDA